MKLYYVDIYISDGRCHQFLMTSQGFSTRDIALVAAIDACNLQNDLVYSIYHKYLSIQEMQDDGWIL